MSNLKKITFFFLLPIFLIGSFAFGEAEEEKIIVHFFEDRMCPVCRDQKDFLEKIKEDYPQIELKVYSITDTEKLHQMAKEKGITDYGIMAPTTFIGDNFFQFRDFTSRHEDMIIRALEGEIVDEDCCIVKIPFLNIEVDIGDWSLPLIALVLGSIDGFNVCSIGALILILSIVLVFKSRRKILFYGGLFIFTAVSIYGVLVFLWGWAFEALVGQLQIVRFLVGLAALGGGIYFFKEFWRFLKYGPTCQVSNNPIVRKATLRVRESFEDTSKGRLFLTGSVILFAAIITIVELPCSVGVPIAFTGVLIAADLPFTSYVYILLFLFFYMLIELIIFLGAVFTKEIWFAGSRMITWVTFLGALVLFYLAFYYLIGF